MKGWTALLWLLASATPLAAEAVADPPASGAEGEPLALGVDADRRLTVPVGIGDAGPFPFVIDTGAERSVISRELAGTLQLAPGRTVKMVAMTGVSKVPTVIIPALSVSTVRGKRIEAPAIDAVHLGAPGMLGIDTLQGHAVRIDFQAASMTVTPSRVRIDQPLRAAPDEIVVEARSKLGQLVVSDAHFRGMRLRIIVDTGSVVSVGNRALQRRMSGVATTPISVFSVTGERLHLDAAQLDAVELGGVTFRNLPVAFADAAPFRRFGLERQPALILGMDALRLFRQVVLDFANRELRLTMPEGMRVGGR